MNAMGYGRAGVGSEYDLDELLARFPLPEGVPDAVMNQDELAGAFDVSVNTVAKYLKAGMPVLEEGGQGRSYMLQLSQCWAWRQAMVSREQDRRKLADEAQTKLQQTLLGLDVDTHQSGLSPRDMREMAQADMAWQMARRRRGELCEVQEVQMLLEQVLAAVRQSVEGMADTLERELSLRPDQVVLVSELSRQVLIGLVERIEAADLVQPDTAPESLFGSLVI